MANEFKVRKGLIVQGSGSAILDIFGSQGQLFSVTDSLSGSLFSVNDISGIPIMEVFSDNTIKLGTYNQEAIIISGSRTGMGTALPQAELHISGANNDSLFRIQSPASSSIVFVSGSGNVGIGTSTPAYRLDVSGSAQIFQNSNSFIRFLTDSNSLTFSDNAPSYLRYGSNIIMAMKSGGGNSTILYGAGSSILSATQNGVSIRSGVDGTLATSMLQVRGSGATSATTALRVENSAATARLTILDDGTSAFNTSHLYVSSSGDVGIGTTTPSFKLDVNGSFRNNGFWTNSSGISNWGVSSGPIAYGVLTWDTGYASIYATSGNRLRLGATGTQGQLVISSSGRVGVGTETPQRLFDVFNSSTGIAASFGGTFSNNDFSGISFGYVEQANTLYRKSALVFERTETHGGGTNASGKIHFLLNNNSSTSATALTDAVVTIDSVGTTVGSARMGIGTRFPTASFRTIR